MTFQQDFDRLVQQCKLYCQKVDKHQLWYQEPFQGHYVTFNKLIEIHLDSKLVLEAMAAGEQSAPGFPNLTPARRQFYKLQEEVPPFLASGSEAYYFLQRYRIDCTHLLKTFSYSTFEGDWKKSRELIEWMGAINNKQAMHDASGSLEKSIDAIKDLGDLAALKNTDLRQLEKDVRNVQALLLEKPELEEKLTEEELILIRQASEHVASNQDILEGLPEIDDSFHYEEPPALDAIVDRCRQLAVLVDDFKKDFDPKQDILDIDQFKRDLKSSFDLSIDICADLYKDVMKEFGAYKVFSLRKLCNTLHRSFNRFSKEKYLKKHYRNGVNARHLDIYRGTPDNIALETFLLLAIGTV